MDSFVSPQIPIILESSAAEETNRFSDSGVTDYSVHQSPSHQTQKKQTHRVCIDRKDVLIKRGIDPNHVPHLMKDFEFQRRHGRIKVHSVEVMHQQNLTVPFTAIARLGALRGFANLDDDHVTRKHNVNPCMRRQQKGYLRNDVSLVLVQPRVHLAIINLFRTFANRSEHQRLRINLGVDTQNIQNDPRRRTVVPAPNDVAVTNDEHQLALVVIVKRRERVNRPSERVLAFGVTGNLAQHKLVQHFRRALAAQL